MAGDAERTTLYSRLRAGFLSRHFAIGRYFRTNHFAERNRLETSLTASEFLKRTPDEQQLERWRRTRDSDNPLLMGSMLTTCVAVEDALGHPHAPRILRSVVATLRSLYKFSGNHFDGYPIRWDPTSSDKWRVQGKTPVISDEFLADAGGAYQYSSSSADPRHSPRRPHAMLAKLMGEAEATRYTQADGKLGEWRDDYFKRYRQFELSMDELVGLIASYSIINTLATSANTRSEVIRQANNLGDYLAEHAWLLVRPNGGLNARGSTGILPALSFPLGRGLLRITGNNYDARTNFQGAMKLAGYWNCLSGDIDKWTALGVAAPVIAPMLVGVIAGLGLFAFVPGAAAAAGIVLPAAGIPAALLASAVNVASVPMARTYAVYQARDCFDLQNDGAAQEVAAAFFLMENIPSSVAFQGWMFSAGFSGGKSGAFSSGFPPFLALTAIDDSDQTVRNAYLSWLTERRNHPELEPTDRTFIGCFATAVAVLLGGGAAEEARLVQLLDSAYSRLFKRPGDTFPDPSALPFNSDLPIGDSTDGAIHWELMHPAMDYMSGLALAWLHAKRCAAAGIPITTPGFPTPPNHLLSWPVPSVPIAVLNDAGPTGQTTLPIAAIDGTSTPFGYSYVDLFPDTPPLKPDPPPAVLPPVPTMMAIDRTITVSKSAGDVDTGIVLNDGDDFEIAATGSIWAGDYAHGNNGPNGWETDITWDSSFPVFGSLDPVNAHPNCLVGRLGGYFFIGGHRPRQRFLYHRSCPLWLGINSNNPGSGNGSFQVRVQVWSTRDLSLRDQIAIHKVTAGSVGALAQAVGVHWPPPPLVSLRNLLLVLNSRP